MTKYDGNDGLEELPQQASKWFAHVRKPLFTETQCNICRKHLEAHDLLFYLSKFHCLEKEMSV